MNSSGLSTQPWGEPVFRVMVEDVLLFILTLCGLQVRKSRTQLQRNEGVPSQLPAWTPISAG